MGALAISLMSLSAAKASIIHLTSGMEQGVSLPGSAISQGKRWLTGSFRIHISLHLIINMLSKCAAGAAVGLSIGWILMSQGGSMLDSFIY